MARLDIDFAAAVRGNRDQVWTADLLWSRLRKDRILRHRPRDAGRGLGASGGQAEEGGHRQGDAGSFRPRQRRARRVTAEGRAAAIAWTPPGFRAFDTGTVDDSASADDEGTTAPEPQPTVADTPLGDAPEDAGDNADGGADPSGADSDTSQSGDPEAGAPADNVADPAQAEAPRPMNARVNSVVREHRCSRRGERRATALASAVNGGYHASGRGVRAGSSRRGRS